jgi:hypothetical protein
MTMTTNQTYYGQGRGVSVDSAQALVKQMPHETLQLMQELLALVRLNVGRIPGNCEQPERALSSIADAVKRHMTVSAAVLAAAIDEARRAYQSLPRPADADRTLSTFGYEQTRVALRSLAPHILSREVAIDRLAEIEPSTLVPFLICEYYDPRDEDVQEILLGLLVRPCCAAASLVVFRDSIASARGRLWHRDYRTFTSSVEAARNVLNDEFAAWYSGIAGVAYEVDAQRFQEAMAFSDVESALRRLESELMHFKSFDFFPYFSADDFKVAKEEPLGKLAQEVVADLLPHADSRSGRDMQECETVGLLALGSLVKTVTPFLFALVKWLLEKIATEFVNRIHLGQRVSVFFGIEAPLSDEEVKRVRDVVENAGQLLIRRGLINVKEMKRMADSVEKIVRKNPRALLKPR